MLVINNIYFKRVKYLLISNPNYVDEIKEDIIKNTNIKSKIQSL